MRTFYRVRAPHDPQQAHDVDVVWMTSKTLEQRRVLVGAAVPKFFSILKSFNGVSFQKQNKKDDVKRMKKFS